MTASLARLPHHARPLSGKRESLHE